MRGNKGRGKRQTIGTELTFSGDHECCHCEILKAIGEFSRRERNSEMETGEMLHSLLHVVVDIFDQAPGDAHRRAAEDYFIEELGTHGLHLMRVEGGRQ